MKVAFQGIRGAYSELALKAYFGGTVDVLGVETFDEVFAAVTSGRVAGGFIPIENTTAGTVVENYDLLLSSDVMITGEACMKIRHCLLGLPGTCLADIREACSHPHALKQCRVFLSTHDIRPVPVYDTAGGARQTAAQDDPGRGAIASALCADIYGLEIIASNIQSEGRNTTRFLVIEKKVPHQPPRFEGKTSIAFQISHRPGSLVDCLMIFLRYGLNLTHLESRPIPQNPWEYVFYSDIESGDDPAVMGAALEELRGRATFVKLLGSYPGADLNAL